MAHEAMECDIQMQLDHPAAEQPAPAQVVSSQGGPSLLLSAPIEVLSSQGGPLLFQPTLAEVLSSQGVRPLLLQPAPAEVVSSQGGGALLLQPAPVDVLSSQGGGPLLLQPAPAEVVSSQGGPLLLQPAPAEVVSNQGGPLLLQPPPAEVVSSQGGPLLLQPAPQVIDLTGVESLRGDNGENNPGAPEAHRQGTVANHTVQVASLDSMNSFISGLQRLHGMLEFLRPPSSSSGGGPVRARRMRGFASRRTRIIGLQRTHGVRSRAPLDAYFQVSRTQPHLPAASYSSETRDPQSEDLHVSSSSDSDSDNSTELEEGIVQAEEPGAVNQEAQLGSTSTEQEAPCGSGEETTPKQSPQISNPLLPSVSMDEEEGDTCTICLEQWTNAGEHRLSALRCGHLFGYRCISKWLKGQTRKCPQCNKKAKHGDIVVLYARTLKALDTSEHERMKSSLLKEQMLRKQAELESAQCRLQLQVLTDECTKLHGRIQDLRKLILDHRDQISQQMGSPAPYLTFLPPSQGRRKYHFQKTFTVSQTGNCRIMTYCDSLSCLVMSQPSPQASLLPGFGVKMLSTADMKSSQYIPMHSKQIRGLAFNSQSKGLLLSASLDSTVKLTSLESNTVVQTYNAGRPVWSCCWCLDDDNYIYAGLVNGSVLVYDLRNTNSPVQELVPQKTRCPLVSLSYIPKADSALFPYGGLLAGTLENASFWERKAGFSHWPHVLPVESGGFVDFQTESNTRHFLVTCRPDKNHSTLRSILMEMSYKLDDAGEPICTCYPVQTFLGGPTCKSLTRGAVFQNPENDGSMLVCQGDEASTCAMLWDASSGVLLQELQADQPVLDICPFEMNHSNYLATLTEKTVQIYRWA